MNKYTHQKLCFRQQPICTVICRQSPVGSNGYPLCDSKHLPMFLFTVFHPYAQSNGFLSVCKEQSLCYSETWHEFLLSYMICAHLELQTCTWLTKCIYYLVSLLAASHHMWPVRSGKAMCSTERGSDPAGSGSIKASAGRP